jgi:hypothetical protein
MAATAYRLVIPLIAVIQEEDSRLMELPAGSLFYSLNCTPDSRGMVKGMCKGHAVLIFACDLEDRAEPLAQVN